MFSFTVQPPKVNLGKNLDTKLRQLFWSVIAEVCICVFMEYWNTSMG